ncbi:50S ribosomal protein L16 [Candidatus Bathyarchaeota archaeon]|nr:50S ribosomal protein L16 [Candidatus Bathyarchaeota archaeon]
MPIRPGKCYRLIKRPPYTRKEYIKRIPGNKVVLWRMGKKRSRNFELTLSLLADEAVQIRHSALEAMRIAANRHLTRILGPEGYFLWVRTYPHQILREKKMMAFAGADRIQEGMRRSFGKPFSLAARVKPGQPVLTLEVDYKNLKAAKDALRRAAMKLPTPCTINLDEAPEELRKKIGF